MSSYVVDSWAWLEYLDGTPTGARVRDVVEKDREIFTTAASLAEVVSVAKRRGKDHGEAATRVLSLSKFVSPDSQDAMEAGGLHAATKEKSRNFSLADAFALQLARKKSARVLTGDPDFKGIKEAELIG